MPSVSRYGTVPEDFAISNYSRRNEIIMISEGGQPRLTRQSGCTNCLVKVTNFLAFPVLITDLFGIMPHLLVDSLCIRLLCCCLQLLINDNCFVKVVQEKIMVLYIVYTMYDTEGKC